MLKFLDKYKKEDAQKRGYMCKRLLCFYSIVSDRTALYNNNFPIFINRYGEVEVILFGLNYGEEDKEQLE